MIGGYYKIGIIWGLFFSQVYLLHAKELEDRTNHWAFQAIKSPTPPVSKNNLAPIDSFILQKMGKEGVEPAPLANRETLIRRLYHDLIGLKPNFQQVQSFLENDRSNAYAILVDELLASPRFGERWGRHWLDLARYADTKGYLAGKKSRAYPFAYTYRDWVIKALNQDMPYHEFIRKQLAADFLVDSPNHPDLAALGFLTVGPRFLNRRQLIIDDRIDVVTRGLMGFTVACARCHDHFHDPIPQEDYYSLYGIFDLSNQPKELPLIGQPDLDSKEYQEFTKKLSELEANVSKHLLSNLDYVGSKEGIVAYVQVCLDGWNFNQNDFEALVAKQKLYPRLANRWKAYLTEKKKVKESFIHPLLSASTSDNPDTFLEKWNKIPHSKFPAFLRTKLKNEKVENSKQVLDWYAEALARALVEARLDKEKKGLVFAVSSNGFPVNLNQEEIEKYFDTKANNKTNDLRAKVAKLEAEHPGSPPRAMSLKDTANIREPQIFLRGNMGSRGERVPRRFLAALSPSNSERNNYSKGSGRLELADSIVSSLNPLTSRVMVNRILSYLTRNGLVRTPSDFGLMGEKPTHPLLLDYLASRFQSFNWSVKSIIREIVRSRAYRRASQTLSPEDPENRLLSSMNPKRLSFETMRDGMLGASGELDLLMGGPSQQIVKKPFSKRRAVYGYIDRQNISPVLNTFDFANPNIHSPQRLETTVPQQALFALNDPFVLERAKRLAQSANQKFSDNNEFPKPNFIARFLYRQVLSRDPKAKEFSEVISFLGPQAPLPKIEDLAQTLLVSNEFFFID